MNKPPGTSLLAAATGLALVLSACSTVLPPAPAPVAEPQPDASSLPSTSMHDAFFDRLTALCGQAFAGEIETDRPVATGPDPFADQALVMHVRECSEHEIRIPFHVGEDSSRTWVVTRTGAGLRLKHDHRHRNGSDDAITMYGGDTAGAGSAGRQEFPVDGFSQTMFSREGMAVSNRNIWAMEIKPGEAFVYELARPGQDRLFRVAFDLTRPVGAPPAPWGSSD